MSREDPHFRLRIPEDLKSKVEKAAAENHRSITAEINARLERSFSQDAFDTRFIPRLEHLERENFERNRDLYRLGMTEEEAKQFVLAIFETMDRFKANEKKFNKKD